MLTTLMLLTLSLGAIIGLAQFFWFIRRKGNRDAAANALLGADRPVAIAMGPEGGLSEILGLGAVALLAMALLLFGYHRQGYESAKNVSPPSETRSPASAREQMTQPAEPRANPAAQPNAPTTVPNASGAPADTTRDNPPPPASPQ